LPEIFSAKTFIQYASGVGILIFFSFVALNWEDYSTFNYFRTFKPTASPPFTKAEIKPELNSKNLVSSQKADNPFLSPIKDSKLRHLIPYKTGEPLHFLLADKSKKILFIFILNPDNSRQQIKSYPIAIGEIRGQKETRGDKKTPEGFYWIIDQKEDLSLPPIYGKRAYVLNYPNKNDMKAGKSGGGIWIHGTEVGKMPDKTKGCLELNNHDVLDVGQYIGPGLPILIAKKIINQDSLLRVHFDYSYLIKKVNRYSYAYRTKLKEGYNFIRTWRNSWAEKDFKLYTSLYSPSFSSGNRDFETWKVHKKNIFSLPQQVKIELSELEVAQLTQNEMVINFYQLYKSATYSGENYKTLTVQREENGPWQIIQEGIVNLN